MAEKEIHTRIPFCDLQIDRQEIYRAMGYREEVPEIQFREMVETMLEELAGLCRPQDFIGSTMDRWSIPAISRWDKSPFGWEKSLPLVSIKPSSSLYS